MFPGRLSPTRLDWRNYKANLVGLLLKRCCCVDEKTSAGRPAAASCGGGTGKRVVSKGKIAREPRRNVEPTGEPKGQGNDQSVKVNEGVDGFSDFSTIIAKQLQNLLPTILAQVGNQGCNHGDNRNQNGNVVNKDIQGNVRNVSVNNNQ
ncbi:hypothetical protein Tco_0941464 [Tanacetum coccineum]|uniref:Uncharacterized protein n=1 Tax=Tanacetum coccineum TaxID=301880 RepID=A0ABQ5DRV6_9ASTR